MHLVIICFVSDEAVSPLQCKASLTGLFIYAIWFMVLIWDLLIGDLCSMLWTFQIWTNSAEFVKDKKIKISPDLCWTINLSDSFPDSFIKRRNSAFSPKMCLLCFIIFLCSLFLKCLRWNCSIDLSGGAN